MVTNFDRENISPFTFNFHERRNNDLGKISLFEQEWEK